MRKNACMKLRSQRGVGKPSVPVLKRATVQSCYDQMLVKNAPKEHGRAIPYSTTGSLGMPVQGLGNELTYLFNSALIVRNHLWHRRDLSGKFAAIRSKVVSNAFPDRGRIESSVFVTGPAAVLNSSIDIDRQLDWVRAEAPTYLLINPSNLRSLLLRALAVRIEYLRRDAPRGFAQPRAGGLATAGNRHLLLRRIRQHCTAVS